MKSQHQRSFGASGADRGVPVARGRRARACSTRPWRSSTAWIVERAGTATSCPSRRASSSRSLRAPQVGCSRRSATIVASTGIGSRFATRPGLRGRSAIASSPCAFHRAKSLWPVFREMPNSRHSAVIGSPSSRRATKRRRSSMTVLSLHGIHTSGREKAESVTHVSGTFCNPCPRPLINARGAHVPGGGVSDARRSSGFPVGSGLWTPTRTGDSR